MHRLIRAVETDAWASMMPTADAFVFGVLVMRFLASGNALAAFWHLMAISLSTYMMSTKQLLPDPCIDTHYWKLRFGNTG